MSIAVCVKIHDGVVIASDSASTLVGLQPEIGQILVMNVYNNANKIFNIVKGLPIGVITWGAGSIGAMSIETVMKNARDEITSGKTRIIRDNYTIEEVAEKMRRYVYDKFYEPAFAESTMKPELAFMIVGYSSKGESPEVWQVTIKADGTDPQKLRDSNSSGVNWGGEVEAITRIIKGYGGRLPQLLTELGVPENLIEDTIAKFDQAMEIPVAGDGMPIQDAIDLAEFLVQLTIHFSRFIPGAPTVGGSVEIASITKHEGFKWIRRKLYYSTQLNQETPQ